MLAPPDRREQLLADLDLPEGLTVELSRQPSVRVGAPLPPPDIMRLFRLDLLGEVRNDATVRQAVLKRQLLIEQYPGSDAAQGVKALANRLLT